jgi:hypothetical protein
VGVEREAILIDIWVGNIRLGDDCER